MGLLAKLFSRGDLLQQVRRAADQGRWAEALALGDGGPREALSATAREELDVILSEAGERLAAWNLQEGEACLRAGDRPKAEEHFLLARDQARQEQTRERAAVRLQETMTGSGSPKLTEPAHCGNGCTPTPQPLPHDEVPVDDSLDPETRLDLLLAGYPPALGQRYARSSPIFLEGLLLAHEGHEEEALKRFELVTPEERDDLFFFERGSAQLRRGEQEAGWADLEEALRLEPANQAARETLVGALLTAGRDEAALRHLQVEIPGLEAFRHSRLALLSERRGEAAEAVEHARQALLLPSGDAESLQLAAAVLERHGQYAEAEGALARLTSGGCAGGENLPLALFWVRRGTHLDRALEIFKRAARRDPGDHRWPLEIAQVYLLRGWTGEGRAILEALVTDPTLAPELRARAENLHTALVSGKTAEIT